LIIAEALNNNKTLELLSLSYNNLSDEGIQSLTNILSLNNSNLKILSLHSTGITDESVKHISKMLKTNTNLTWLHLGANKISDQGVHLLADVLIRYNKTLKILALSENELITDSSVDSLVKIFKQNDSLETLWINECNLSVDGKKKLKQIFQSNIRLFALVVDSPKFGRKIKMPKK
jgi:Ran GTPase-activating protein (RanGAP) involved in mRNA processing and transport